MSKLQHEKLFFIVSDVLCSSRKGTLCFPFKKIMLKRHGSLNILLMIEDWAAMFIHPGYSAVPQVHLDLLQ